MPTLNLKPTHKSVKAYYESLDQFERLGVTHETAVRSAFQALLESCGKQFKWTLVPEHSISLGRNRRIVIDGVLIDDFNLTHGHWEAKDIHDDLPTEVQRKFEAGYPGDNILFQTPKQAILWQNDKHVLDADLTDPTRLIETLQTFFSYRPQEITEWEEAVAQFKDRVPDIGRGLAKLIQKERQTNRQFTTAFVDFYDKCRQSINPNLSEAAVELSKDKTQIQYNDFLTLDGIPPEALDYRLGNRSALEWVIDQYRIKTDKRSGIVNDPNREDDPQYIVKLIGKVIAVSLETVEIVEGLPELNVPVQV